MELLKKENWWIWLMLAFLSGGSSILVLGALLDLYDHEAWYYRWMKKFPKGVVIVVGIIIGFVALFSPFILSFMAVVDIPQTNFLPFMILSILLFIYMLVSLVLLIFQIQILAQVNAKLQTPGSEIYLSPYVWILGLIIPIIGWIMLLVMYVYLQIWYLVMLYRNGESQ